MVYDLIDRHDGQYWGEYPYIEHLYRVAKLATLIKNDKELHLLSMLHDVIEDTDTKLEEIPVQLQEDIIILSRNLNQQCTYNQYIDNIVHNGSENAKIVKFCDSVINYGLCLENGKDDSRYKTNIEKLYPTVFGVEVNWDLIQQLVEDF